MIKYSHFENTILTNHPGIHKKFWNFALFHQHQFVDEKAQNSILVDIHNIYEIHLIPN